MSRTTPSFLALLIGLLASGAAMAQSGDATRGRDLWSDTPGVSGIQMITANCSNCHTVDQRRSQIGGSVFADISFDTAMSRLSAALNNQSAMATFRQLQPQDVFDLAAYIADTPKTTTANLDFTASAVNTATAAQTVDLAHSAAPLGGSALLVTGVAIGGTGASAFTLASNSCNGATLAASNTCRVGITFSAPDTAGKSATLTLSLRQGSTNFSRSVALSGAVAGSSGGGGAGNSGDSGGGALGLGWLAALATAALALAATGRSRSRRSRRTRAVATARTDR